MPEYNLKSDMQAFALNEGSIVLRDNGFSLDRIILSGDFIYKDNDKNVNLSKVIYEAADAATSETKVNTVLNEMTKPYIGRVGRETQPSQLYFVYEKDEHKAVMSMAHDFFNHLRFGFDVSEEYYDAEKMTQEVKKRIKKYTWNAPLSDYDTAAENNNTTFTNDSLLMGIKKDGTKLEHIELQNSNTRL